MPQDFKQHACNFGWLFVIQRRNLEAAGTETTS
jgi:hypothetical protein